MWGILYFFALSTCVVFPALANLGIFGLVFILGGIALIFAPPLFGKTIAYPHYSLLVLSVLLSAAAMSASEYTVGAMFILCVCVLFYNGTVNRLPDLC